MMQSFDSDMLLITESFLMYSFASSAYSSFEIDGFNET